MKTLIKTLINWFKSFFYKIVEVDGEMVRVDRLTRPQRRRLWLNSWKKYKNFN